MPELPVTHALLTELSEPLLSSTLMLPGDENPLNDAEAIRTRLEHEVDLILDGGTCGIEPTTVIDLSEPEPILIRKGKGDITSFGFTG